MAQCIKAQYFLLAIQNLLIIDKKNFNLTTHFEKTFTRRREATGHANPRFHRHPSVFSPLQPELNRLSYINISADFLVEQPNLTTTTTIAIVIKFHLHFLLTITANLPAAHCSLVSVFFIGSEAKWRQFCKRLEFLLQHLGSSRIIPINYVSRLCVRRQVFVNLVFFFFN